MASERRNMLYENKKQETTEIAVAVRFTAEDQNDDIFVPDGMPFDSPVRFDVAGMRFALLQMKYALVRMLNEFEMELSPVNPPVIEYRGHSIITTPKHPLWFNFKRISH
ncbi:hypothetical protein AAG570_005245 [Ranatra chinensis]|uniref:Cytochrome P450 n=1 Tax=Ranatra chinensis TaxID=642074 RepID=A0ABD0YER3_9HEMI